jgi:hypothetical protein
MKSVAIVLDRSPEAESARKPFAVPPTVFEAFLVKLHERRSSVALRSMAGAAVWSDVPLLSIVADGLWPILQRAAEKMGFPLSGDEAILRVTRRVDYVLAAGLLLQYKTMDDAADDFWKTVIFAGMNDAREHVGKGVISPKLLWKVKTTTYFAALMRASMQAADEAERLLRSEFRQPMFREGTEFLLNVLPEQQLETMMQHLAALWLKGGPRHLSVSYVEGIVGWARTLAARARVCRLLPIRLHRLQNALESSTARELASPYSVAESWISTQALLAMADAPIDDEEIDAPTFRRGQPVMRAATVDDIVRAFLHRMEERGLRLSSSDLVVLIKTVRIAIEDRLRIPWEGKLNNATTEGYLTNILFAEMDMEKNVAKAFLLGEAAHEAAERSVRDNAAEKAIATLDWTQVSADDLAVLFRGDTVDEGDLLVGLRRVPKSVLEEAVHLVQRDVTVPEIVHRMVVDGLIDPTDAEIVSYLSELSDERIHTRALAILSHFTNGSLGDSGSFLKPLADRLLRMSLPKRRKLFGQPHLRDLVLTIVTETTSLAAGSHEFTEDELRLRDMLGTELWIRFHLAQDVYYRASLYSGVSDAEERSTMFPVWERRHELHHLPEHRGIDIRIGVSANELRELMLVHSEEEILRWYAESQPQPEEFVRTYLGRRQRYYESWGVTLSEPVKKPTAKKRAVKKPSKKKV